MTSTAQPDDSPGQTQQNSSFGYCSWHKGHSRGVRLIRVHEQGSGAGGGTYACPPCRQEHNLVPFADRPL